MEKSCFYGAQFYENVICCFCLSLNQKNLLIHPSIHYFSRLSTASFQICFYRITTEAKIDRITHSVLFFFYFFEYESLSHDRVYHYTYHPTQYLCPFLALDYLIVYRRKLIPHPISSQEALAWQQYCNAYLLITSNKNWYKSMGFRNNNIYSDRLIRQA